MTKFNTETDVNWQQKKIAVVAARWNSFVTDDMLSGAVAALQAKGVPEKNIYTMRCPGAFELPLACKWCLQHDDVDAVVAIGAVIRGGTPHFDYICDAVTDGIAHLNLEYGKPVSFGVLTTDTVEQAVERASTEKGNKGAEAALAVIDMILLKEKMKEL